jgi:integrase
MASVLRYPSSRYWIACFRDANGRQFRRSTRETVKTRALAVATAFERAAKAKGSAQRVRQVLSAFLAEHFDEELPAATVADFFSRWLAARRREIAESSFHRYGIAVASFLSFLGPRASRGIDAISREDITAFRDSLALSPASANFALKIARRIFRAARLEGLILRDPAEGVAGVRDRRARLRRPFTMGELRAVVEVADDEWRSMVKVGIYTGLRLSDIAALSWAQVDLPRGEIRLHVRKTGKALLLPIAAPLHAHLLALAGADEPGAPLHPRAFAAVSHGRTARLSAQFARLLVSAGVVAPGQGKRVGLTFHSLRHTAVFLLKDSGAPDAVVMALVGHSSVAMSQRYTHVGMPALAKAAGALPQI